MLEGAEVALTDRSKCSHSVTEWTWQCPSNNQWKSTEQNPKIKFTVPGTHAIMLQVTRSTGRTGGTSRTVKVLEDFVKAEFEPRDAIVAVKESS